MSEWQDIETAPKDGTRVLVYAPGHLHMIGTYGSFGYYFGPCWWSNGATISPPPTHWMPLPEFPARATAPCLTLAEKKAQAARCACRGADDLCPCQNRPDAITLGERSYPGQNRKG